MNIKKILIIFSLILFCVELNAHCPRGEWAYKIKWLNDFDKYTREQFEMSESPNMPYVAFKRYSDLKKYVRKVREIGYKGYKLELDKLDRYSFDAKWKKIVDAP